MKPNYTLFYDSLDVTHGDSLCRACPVWPGCYSSIVNVVVVDMNLVMIIALENVMYVLGLIRVKC